MSADVAIQRFSNGALMQYMDSVYAVVGPFYQTYMESTITSDRGWLVREQLARPISNAFGLGKALVQLFEGGVIAQAHGPMAHPLNPRAIPDSLGLFYYAQLKAGVDVGGPVGHMWFERNECDNLCIFTTTGVLTFVPRSACMGIPGARFEPVPADSNQAPYNLIRWVSAHNSYQAEGPAGPLSTGTLLNNGVRSLELDINGGPSWEIRHHPIPGINVKSKNCPYLADCLRQIASFMRGRPLSTADVITLWIQVNEPWRRGGAPEDLDHLLEQELGAWLYRPENLRAWCVQTGADGAASLQAAVRRAGWPPVSVLSGKVLVVLTAAGLDEYARARGQRASAFVAPDLDAFAAKPHQLDAVFFNSTTDVEGWKRLTFLAWVNGFVSRGWQVTPEQWDVAASAFVNHVATDMVPGGTRQWDSNYARRYFLEEPIFNRATLSLALGKPDRDIGNYVAPVSGSTSVSSHEAHEGNPDDRSIVAGRIAALPMHHADTLEVIQLP